MTEPTEKPATQKLARGASHSVPGKRYVGQMPLEMFRKLPDKVQIKMKAAVKSQEVDAEKIRISNMTQAEKTALAQAEVQKAKDEKAKKDAKPGK